MELRCKLDGRAGAGLTQRRTGPALLPAPTATTTGRTHWRRPYAILAKTIAAGILLITSPHAWSALREERVQEQVSDLPGARFEVETVRDLFRLEGPIRLLREGGPPRLQLIDRAVPLRDVVEVRFVRRTVRPVGIEVALTDGGRLFGELRKGESAEQIRVIGPLHPSGVLVPMERVRWLRPVGARSVPELDGTSSSNESPASESDVLYLDDGSSPAGVLLAADEVGVSFESDALGELRYSWEQVRAVAMADLDAEPDDDRGAPPGTLPIVVHGIDGSQVVVQAESIDPAHIAGVSTALGELRIPMRRILALEPQLGRIVYLSTRDPVRVEEGNPFTSPEIFRALYHWRRNRSAGPEAGPLQIGTRVFRRGLGVHSASRLEFEILPGDVLFQSWLGIDISGHPVDRQQEFGSVVFRVELDGKPHGEPIPMDWTKPARRLEVPLSGHRRLALIVDMGPGLHVLDRADWGDARIIRE